MKRMKCSSGPDSELLSTNQTVIWYDFKALERAEKLVWCTIWCENTHTHSFQAHWPKDARGCLFIISRIFNQNFLHIALNFEFQFKELIKCLKRARPVQSLSYTDTPVIYNLYLIKSLISVQYSVIYNMRFLLDYRHTH